MITVVASYTTGGFTYSDEVETTLMFPIRAEYEAWSKYAGMTGVSIVSVHDDDPPPVIPEREAPPHIFDGIDFPGGVQWVNKGRLFAARHDMPGDVWGHVVCSHQRSREGFAYIPIERDHSAPFFTSLDAAWAIADQLIEKTNSKPGGVSVISFEWTPDDHRCSMCGYRDQPGKFVGFHAAGFGERCDACAEDYGCNCDCFDTDKE